MSYFPTDIPFMSDEELIENGLKKPYKKPEIIKGTDLVPVVRCRDCKHWQTDWNPSIPDRHYCAVMDSMMKADDFCSYGEKREE